MTYTGVLRLHAGRRQVLARALPVALLRPYPVAHAGGCFLSLALAYTIAY